MRGLAGKVALVDGAGGPMGRAIAARLANIASVVLGGAGGQADYDAAFMTGEILAVSGGNHPHF
jgi:NAD(P)-dependent dehydrogenase (short-subunit alcohol dehydrogenase family)